MIGCRPFNPNKSKRNTENGLFRPLVVSHIRELHSNISADFMGEVYLWNALLYFKPARNPRRFSRPWTKALYDHLGLFALLGLSHSGNISRLYSKQKIVTAKPGTGRVSIA